MLTLLCCINHSRLYSKFPKKEKTNSKHRKSWMPEEWGRILNWLHPKEAHYFESVLTRIHIIKIYNFIIKRKEAYDADFTKIDPKSRPLLDAPEANRRSIVLRTRSHDSWLGFYLVVAIARRSGGRLKISPEFEGVNTV